MPLFHIFCNVFNCSRWQAKCDPFYSLARSRNACLILFFCLVAATENRFLLAILLLLSFVHCINFGEVQCMIHVAIILCLLDIYIFCGLSLIFSYFPVDIYMNFLCFSKTLNINCTCPSYTILIPNILPSLLFIFNLGSEFF